MALPSGRPGDFYTIAHRAGNNLHHLERALDAGVDAIECDFWHARGRLVLRHERKLPALPVLYDKWYVRWAWGTLSLPVLLREINLRAELFLDIKSSTKHAADAVLKLYHDNESMMPRTRVSSKKWKLLDRLARAGTDMEMFYSVAEEPGVKGLLARCKAPNPPHGTSIRHTLLTRQRVERLHDAGLVIYAWTVNRDERVRELLDWGVDGIIADDVNVLRRFDRAMPQRRERAV